MSVRIAPSILSADFARAWPTRSARVEAAGADLIHVDVMDGHFVPNITIGPPVVTALRRVTRLPLDVHLMIQEPDRYLDAFVAAGAAMVIGARGSAAASASHAAAQSAISARRPASRSTRRRRSPPSRMSLAELDHVLIMSVNPGFGGQTFIPHTLRQVARGARRCSRRDGSHRGRSRSMAASHGRTPPPWSRPACRSSWPAPRSLAQPDPAAAVARAATGRGASAGDS